MRRAVVIPVYAEGNKGDEALAFMTGEFAKSVIGIDEVVFLADTSHCKGPWINNGTGVGYRLLESFVKSPRRGIAAREQRVVDSLLNTVLLALIALKDLIVSVWLLLSARCSLMANLALPESMRCSYLEIARCDVVLVKGGGFLHAHRGVRWVYYLWFQVSLMILAIRMRKPVIVLPNSFGPFDGVLSKYLAKRVLGGCAFVSARESISAHLLGKMLGTSIGTYADLAFNLKPASLSHARDYLLGLGVPVDSECCVGLTVRPWRFPGAKHPEEAYESYVRTMQSFVRYLVERGYTPVFFQQTASPSVHEDDKRAIDDVTSKLADIRYFIVHSRECSCSELMALYGNMKYTVGTRFHSVIFSLAMRVPSVAITYGGNKGEGIMKDIGLSEYAISIDELLYEKLRGRFEKLVKNESAVIAAVDLYLERARTDWNDLCGEVNRVLRVAHESVGS